MNILVSGGAGYIGSQVSYDLISNGHNVTIIDNISEYEKLCMMISCREVGYYTGKDLGFWASFFRDKSNSIEIKINQKD